MHLIRSMFRRWPGAVLAAVALCASSPAWAGSARTDPDMPGEVLVKLNGSAALPGLLSRYPLTLAGQFGSRPIYRLKLIGGARLKTVMDGLAREPSVQIVETNPIHSSPEARRNMPWTIGSAGPTQDQWALQAMRLPQAQALSMGTGMRVAVLDTGVDLTHPALAGRLLAGFDFVDFDTDPSEVGSATSLAYGHGTHVAGLVAMAAPGAQIMPLRVLDTDGLGNAWVLAEAMLHAVDPDGNPATDDGAHVINLSLGSMNRTRILDSIAMIVSCLPAVPGDPIADRSDPGYAGDEQRCAAGTGAVVVAAAGNDASRSVKEYPAAEGVYGLVAVAATASNGTVAAFSNYGPWIDLAAPGDGIASTFPGGGYATWSGTSMASPLVAGTVALVRARSPGLTPKDVVARLQRTGAALCGKAAQLQVDAHAAVADGLPSPIACR